MSIILRVGAVKPLRTQDTQYGSGDEACGSYTDADVVDIPLPEHTYQRPLPAVLSQPQNNPNTFGLPYPDHNYGMLPPPSPPRPPSPDPPPSPLQINGVVQLEEEVKTSPMVSVVEEVVEDSITRCICGYLHDDGYMICCDKCSVWQHIDCMAVDRNDIPDNYFCELCQPRLLDAVKAKALQKLKREELAARNVLSDSSATDTDPEEPVNAMASMVKKPPVAKKKGPKQKKKMKAKEKANLKLKIPKVDVPKKLKKSGKKEKENIKAVKPKKIFKPGMRKLKEMKSRPLMVTEQFNSDPWDCNSSPWIDAYETIHENIYSDGILKLLRDSSLFRSGDVTTFSSSRLRAQLLCIAEVKKNRKGLKAVDNILAGQGIIEYTGRVMLKQEHDQQLFKATSALQPFVLFFSKGDVTLCVDATVSGNESRFVRRSCMPNTQVQLQCRDNKIHFVIEAKQDINSGTEITIAFDYDFHLSSICIECACLRSNCGIVKFWKKKKKSQQKEILGRKKRQLSVDSSKSVDNLPKVTSPQGSPRKIQSPGRSSTEAKSPCSAPAQIHSPIRLSVSTLLAASALLEAQSEASSDVQDNLSNNIQTKTSPIYKSATSHRRGSKAFEDIKEEKISSPTFHKVETQKEKPLKSKESKNKVKESIKETNIQSVVEVKKERRLSTRRHSQEDANDEEVSVKEELSANTELKEEHSEEHYRKMTREERKLDAIMKAFEKMEKREERRKEAIARGEGSSKKTEFKVKKKEDSEEDNVKPILQEGGIAEEEVKVEVDDIPGKSPTSSIGDKDVISSPTSSGQMIDPIGKDVQPAKEEPTNTITTATTTLTTTPAAVHKPGRRFGKRKRRRSRVHTAPPLTETKTTPLIEETSPGNSISQLPSTNQPIPASAPVQSSSIVEPVEAEPEEFKFIKSKKHLFNEWSHRHEDENSTSNSKDEMFVECLPSPRVNAMDHLQRRNSQSAGCNRSSESSGGGGFAKKRWLRQAMHEEPAPVPVQVPFNNSLSITTENGHASPINGSISPNNSVVLQSPGASSPLDFVTPLKKRRLMRESLSVESNGSIHSPVSRIVSEQVTAVDVVAPKSNGFKSFIPSHRLSVDDRLLLRKNYPLQNGFREKGENQCPGLFKKTNESTPSSVSVCLKFDSSQPASESKKDSSSTSLVNQETPNVKSNVTSHHLVNGFSRGVDCVTTVSLSPSKSAQPVIVRTRFEKMDVDSSSRIRDTKPSSANVFSPEKMGVKSALVLNSNRTDEEQTKLNNPSLSDRVVVNSVYNNVNNLMENSESSCVVTKSIMEMNGPATVCVDLNAHHMEPSSLSSDQNKTVVNLDEKMFPGIENDQKNLPETRNIYPSSSKVEDASSNLSVPLLDQGQSSSCDIRTAGLRSNWASVTENKDGLLIGNSEPETSLFYDKSELRRDNMDTKKVSSNEAGPSTSTPFVSKEFLKRSLEVISSSSPKDMCVSKVECDSMGLSKESQIEEDSGIEITISASLTEQQCISDNIVSASHSKTQLREEPMEIDVSPSCDSAGNIMGSLGYDPSGSQAESNQLSESMELSDSDTKASCSQHKSSIVSTEEAGIDSTSSETVKEMESLDVLTDEHTQGNVTNYCDSNSDFDNIRNEIENDNDATSEELGVSSSSSNLVQSLDNEAGGVVMNSSDDVALVVREEATSNDLATQSSNLPSGSLSNNGVANISSNSSQCNHTNTVISPRLMDNCSSSSMNILNSSISVNDRPGVESSSNIPNTSGLLSHSCDRSPSPQSSHPLSSAPQGDSVMAASTSAMNDTLLNHSTSTSPNVVDSSNTLGLSHNGQPLNGVDSSITLSNNLQPPNSIDSSNTPGLSSNLLPHTRNTFCLSNNPQPPNGIDSSNNLGLSSDLRPHTGVDSSYISGLFNNLQPPNGVDSSNNLGLSNNLQSPNGVDSSNTFICSRNLRPSPSSSMSSPPYSSAATINQEDFIVSSMVSTSGTPDQEMTPATTSALSPTASTSSEAVPATKKKVSLLEYRKRLKKPVTASTDSKTSAALVSVPCTTVTLSSVCERFLSSSSPSSSGSSSTFSSSVTTSSPTKRHHKMPTLATLPLFKSVDKKIDDKKPSSSSSSSSKDRKRGKHLSLTDRLRLEFGLEDTVAETKNKSVATVAVDSSTSQDEAPPPPPPPLPPPSKSSSSSRSSPRPSSSSSSSTSLHFPIPPAVSSSSSIPGVGYVAPLVNGSLLSGHNVNQQPSISSTSLLISQPREKSSNIVNYPRSLQQLPTRNVSPYQSSSASASFPQSHQAHNSSVSPSSSSSSSSSSIPSVSQKSPGISNNYHHRSHTFSSVPPSIPQPSSTSSYPPAHPMNNSLRPQQKQHHQHPSIHQRPHQQPFHRPPHPHPHTSSFDYHHGLPSQSSFPLNASTMAQQNFPLTPPLPQQSHLSHHPLSSSYHHSTSSSHQRHESNSNDRNKKAASSSSSSSSLSSSSRFSDKRNRY